MSGDALPLIIFFMKESCEKVAKHFDIAKSTCSSGSCVKSSKLMLQKVLRDCVTNPFLLLIPRSVSPDNHTYLSLKLPLSSTHWAMRARTLRIHPLQDTVQMKCMVAGSPD
eukprot:c11056_g1_i1 orf=275-607(+)